MVEMTAQEAAEWGKTLSSEKVWAAFMETDRKFAEAAKYSAKVDTKIDRLTETVDKMGERVARVTANVGSINQSMGELIETFFASHLGEKFDAYVTIQSPAGDSEHRRNEGAFSPEMEPIGSERGW